MNFKGTNTKWELNPTMLKNEYGVKYLTIDFPELSHAQCIDIYDGEISDETELYANALIVSKAKEMLFMLNKICGELNNYNPLKIEAEKLIIDATEFKIE